MIKNIIGHDKTKTQLEVAIKSAHERNISVPHMIFSGVAGCGKTTLAMEIAKASHVDFISESPDSFTDRKSVMRILDKLNDSNYSTSGDRTGELHPTLLFVDEIHRMPRKGQEIMGIAMEKFMLETGKVNSFYWIPYFTLIGATTDDGELTKPFREKFKLRFLFQTYSLGEATEIIKLHAKKNNIIITDLAARAIARRSRGVPRMCVSYLERTRDYQNFVGAAVITKDIAEENFKHMGIDAKGLNSVELRILEILHDSKAPIGIDNLAIMSNESSKNLKNTIEPFLIQQGFIVRSSKGRVITDAGRQHLLKTGAAGKAKSRVEIGAGYVRK